MVIDIQELYEALIDIIGTAMPMIFPKLFNKQFLFIDANDNARD